jgi:putative transposase
VNAQPMTAPNQVGSMDFLSDQLFDGSKIRILAIFDAYSKMSPAIAVRQHYRGVDIVDTLERVKAVCGKPRAIRVDNGPEFIYKDLDLWDWCNGVTLVFSRPGKPTEKAFVESFNGKVRAECVDQNRFLSLDDAQSKCEAYRREYNEERPHSTIDNKTPMEFMTPIGQTSRPVA